MIGCIAVWCVRVHVYDYSGLASEEVRCSVSAGDIQYNALQRSSIPSVCAEYACPIVAWIKGSYTRYVMGSIAML